MPVGGGHGWGAAGLQQERGLVAPTSHWAGKGGGGGKSQRWGASPPPKHVQSSEGTDLYHTEHSGLSWGAG